MAPLLAAWGSLARRLLANRGDCPLLRVALLPALVTPPGRRRPLVVPLLPVGPPPARPLLGVKSVACELEPNLDLDQKFDAVEAAGLRPLELLEKMQELWRHEKRHPVLPNTPVERLGELKPLEEPPPR